MKTTMIRIAGAMLIAALLGCNLTNVAGPTPTLTATVTLTPIGGVTATSDNTRVPTTLPVSATPTTRPAAGSATPTDPAQAAATNTAPAATGTRAAPTATRPAATNTPRPPSPTWAGMSEVMIYLIAISDDGATGTKIGCGDSVVGVKRVLAAPTQAPLRAAINELLSIKDRDYGQSGLMTALYQSSLTLSDVNIRNRVAIIELTGTLTLGGTCDSPRVKAQLEFTALQFTTVDSTQITLNGVPLDDALSQK